MLLLLLQHHSGCDGDIILASTVVGLSKVLPSSTYEEGFRVLATIPHVVCMVALRQSLDSNGQTASRVKSDLLHQLDMVCICAWLDSALLSFLSFHKHILITF